MRAAALGLAGAWALAACGNPSVGGAGDGAPRFTVGAIELTAVSGAAVPTAYGLRLYLSDQPDTCDAISFVPQAQWNLLELRVAPQAGGAGQASVAATKPVPAAGEAVGAISRLALATPQVSYDAGDGTIAWTAAADGTVTVTALDVGFSGAAGRIAAERLVLEACAP